MDDFQSAVAAGAKLALCTVLGSYGAAAPKLAATAVGAPTPATIAAAVGAGLSLYAFANNCTWDPNGAGPPSGEGSIRGCMEAADGMHLNVSVWVKGTETGDRFVPISGGNVSIAGDGVQGEGDARSYYVDIKNNDTSEVTRTVHTYYSDGSNAVQGEPVDPITGDPAACKVPAPEGPAPRPGPVSYTDPASGCEINVTLLGWTLGPANTVGGTYLIEPAPASRATGGVIGGCNFEPVVYIDQRPTGGGGGGGGDGPIVPLPPDWPGPEGDDWWKDLAKAALEGLLYYTIGRALDEVFSPVYAGGSRTLTAACNYKADGSPEEFTVTYPAEKFGDAVFTALDMIMDFQQQILKWKTPVCFGNHHAGEPYTLTWVSDETNAQGNALVKEMKYWDQSGKTHEEHFLHWKDFVWQAGPVMVGVAGSVLGKMQVWAASETEGRRVVDHAASISGVTLTADNYVVSTSKSSRVGQPGTMRIQQSRGLWMVANRDGPIGPPTYPTG